jgi:flagellar assembly protein FliH
MGAPAKFLFDVDFAAGREREATVPLAEHAARLADAEAAAHRRGYAEAQNDAAVEAGRRIAATLERVAASLGEATKALAAVEARLECEAVEVAVAVARKLAPTLIEREPFAEIAALASSCFRELVAAPHIAVRINDSLYATAREKLRRYQPRPRL